MVVERVFKTAQTQMRYLHCQRNERNMMAALSYVAFTFLQIKVPLPGGDATSFRVFKTAQTQMRYLHCQRNERNIRIRALRPAKYGPARRQAEIPSACWGRCWPAAFTAAWAGRSG